MEIASASHFKEIGKKFQTGEELTHVDRDVVFSLALEHTNKLLENLAAPSSNAMYGDREKAQQLQRKSKMVRNYTSALALLRMLSLSEKALSENLSGAESLIRVEDLGKSIREKLSIPSDKLSNDELIDKIRSAVSVSDQVDPYLRKHKISEVDMSMNIIRDVAAVVVPNNPSTIKTRV